MTSFSRIARSGMVPIADAFRPTTEKGTLVADKLQVLARQVRQGFERVQGDGYMSKAAERKAAETHVAECLKTARRIGAEVDRLRREAEEQGALVDGAVQKLEREMTLVSMKRMERLGNQLRHMSHGQRLRVLDEAVVRRDLDVLLAAWSEGLQGSREAIQEYAVGRERAESARALAREALVAEQAFQCMSLGIEGMQQDPTAWVADTSGARPEERLAVCSAGAMAFLEVQAAAKKLEDRWQDGLEDQSTDSTLAKEVIAVDEAKA